MLSLRQVAPAITLKQGGQPGKHLTVLRVAFDRDVAGVLDRVTSFEKDAEADSRGLAN